MDSVKASKFITQKKTEELIEKISKLNFIFRGRMVKSNVLIDDISKNIQTGGVEFGKICTGEQPGLYTWRSEGFGPVRGDEYGYF